MAFIVATASMACNKPWPFLLQNEFDILNQLVIVPDDNWDWTMEFIQGLLRPGEKLNLVDTPKGQFLSVTDDQIDPDTWARKVSLLEATADDAV